MRIFKIIPKMRNKQLRYVVREQKERNIYNFWGKKTGVELHWHRHGERIPASGYSEYSFDEFVWYKFKSIKKAKQYIYDFCKTKRCDSMVIAPK